MKRYREAEKKTKFRHFQKYIYHYLKNPRGIDVITGIQKKRIERRVKQNAALKAEKEREIVRDKKK